MMIGFFWHVTLCCLPHDAGRRTPHVTLRNVGIYRDFLYEFGGKSFIRNAGIIIQTTRRHTPQEVILHTVRCANTNYQRPSICFLCGLLTVGVRIIQDLLYKFYVKNISDFVVNVQRDKKSLFVVRSVRKE